MSGYGVFIVNGSSYTQNTPAVLLNNNNAGAPSNPSNLTVSYK